MATIGAFDGVHLGHQAVLQKLREKSAEYGLPALVITLEPLPREFFAPEEAPARILSFREKIMALREEGIDRLLAIRFNRAFSAMPAEDFVRKVLWQQLGVSYLIVGDDLRFGAGRKGDFSLLQRMGSELGFQVADTGTVHVDGERVSSSRIREALEQSDFGMAGRLMGRPYAITGKVVHGQHLGRTIGVPTLNLLLRRKKAALSGVYVVRAVVDGISQQGVANVGTRPTVHAGQRVGLEVHLLDFSRDVYGSMVQVIFCRKLRGEKKFGSLDELKTAINHDIASARHFFTDGIKHD